MSLLIRRSNSLRGINYSARQPFDNVTEFFPQEVHLVEDLVPISHQLRMSSFDPIGLRGFSTFSSSISIVKCFRKRSRTLRVYGADTRFCLGYMAYDDFSPGI